MRVIQSILRSVQERLDRVNFVERGAIVQPGAWVSGSSLGPFVRVETGCKVFKAKLEGKTTIQRFTSLWGPDIHISGSINGVSIGAFCSIAHHVSMQESFHNVQRTTTYFVERNLLELSDEKTSEISRGQIVVGNDVWIGAGAQVLSGVTIGDGAIIGAGAIVTRDVPPYTICGGNPARVIRARFSSDVVKRLQASQWWTWPVEQLRAEADFLTKLHDRSK